MVQVYGDDPRTGRGLRTLFLALGLVAAPGPLAAETFPAALDPPTVQDWLRREAGASPDQVVAISPSAATRILKIDETAPGRRRVLVDAQALNAQAAARTGVLAWRMPLEVDCGTGRVKVGATTGYESRRGVGPGVPLRGADADWRDAPAGTQLEFLRNAACRTRTKAPAPAPATRRAAATPALTRAPVPVKASHQEPAPAVAMQVVSTPDRAEAEATLRRLQLRLGPKATALQTAVVRAQVNGATTYRGMLTGFASHQAAATLCAELQAARQACFLRQAPRVGPPLKPVATR